MRILVHDINGRKWKSEFMSNEQLRSDYGMTTEKFKDFINDLLKHDEGYLTINLSSRRTAHFPLNKIVAVEIRE